MNAFFNGQPVTLKKFMGRTFSLIGFELDDVLWLLLDEVLETLKLTDADLKELKEEEPDDFAELDDGRAVIQEGGCYFLALFRSETPEAQELTKWAFGEVIPSIEQKGYYSLEEAINGKGKVSKKLKRCPFCGEIAGVVPDRIKYKNGEIEEIYSVKCYGCSGGTTFYFDVDDAIEQWNVRAEEEQS